MAARVCRAKTAKIIPSRFLRFERLRWRRRRYADGSTEACLNGSGNRVAAQITQDAAGGVLGWEAITPHGQPLAAVMAESAQGVRTVYPRTPRACIPLPERCRKPRKPCCGVAGSGGMGASALVFSTEKEGRGNTVTDSNQ